MRKKKIELNKKNFIKSSYLSTFFREHSKIYNFKYFPQPQAAAAQYPNHPQTTAPPPMYPKLLSAHPNLPVTIPSLHLSPSFRISPEILNPILQRHHSVTFRRQIKCTANDSNGGGSSKNWEKWLPRNLFAAEKVFGAIAGATSSPIAQYISSPTTFLHSVDPRIKMVSLLSFPLVFTFFFWRLLTSRFCLFFFLIGLVLGFFYFGCDYLTLFG